jgi:predicted Abi (CAAX) family protease
MFLWLEKIGLDSYVESLRNYTRWLAIFLPTWIIFSLPNALWLFSGILIFETIWGSKQSTGKIFWLSLFLITAIGAEIAQGLSLLPGTFDWQDILLMLIACFCAILFIAYVRQKERRQESWIIREP